MVTFLKLLCRQVDRKGPMKIGCFRKILYKAVKGSICKTFNKPQDNSPNLEQYCCQLRGTMLCCMEID